MTFWIFSAKIDLKFFKKQQKKARASLDFSKSSDEKQISKLEGPYVSDDVRRPISHLHDYFTMVDMGASW